MTQGFVYVQQTNFNQTRTLAVLSMKTTHIIYRYCKIIVYINCRQFKLLSEKRHFLQSCNCINYTINYIKFYNYLNVLMEIKAVIVLWLTLFSWWIVKTLQLLKIGLV